MTNKKDLGQILAVDEDKACWGQVGRGGVDWQCCVAHLISRAPLCKQLWFRWSHTVDATEKNTSSYACACWHTRQEFFFFFWYSIQSTRSDLIQMYSNSQMLFCFLCSCRFSVTWVVI